MVAASEITRLLHACRDGNADAGAQLFTHVYHELKRLARRHAPRGRREATLDTTGLVHETYARLIAHTPLDAASREHFFALCGRAMRQIVIDYARRREAGKRGGDAVVMELQDADAPMPGDPCSLVALDQALQALERHDPRLVRLVELRAFAGLSPDEIADVLGVTVRTVQRDWLRARVWLDEALQA